MERRQATMPAQQTARSRRFPLGLSPKATLLFTATTVLLTLLAQLTLIGQLCTAQTISIKPTEFERLIMPCYLGGGFYQGGGSSSYGQTTQSTYSSQPQFGGRLGGGQSAAFYGAQQGADQATNRAQQQQQSSSSFLGSSSGQQPHQQQSLSSSLSGAGPLNGRPRDSLTNNLGQTVPRASTIENFISLIEKVEVANPRLSNDPDQLIRSLLSRFRLDNYYYDVRSRTPISEQDRRTTDILPALLNSNLSPLASQQQQFGPSAADLTFALDRSLDHDEKCSMYFMLSHFVDKSSSQTSPALGQLPVNQLAGPLASQRPPVLQAAGSGYPASSAAAAFGGNGGTQRYPGPSPSFGSPLTSQMTGFGSGLTNSNPELAGQRNQYGLNSPTTQMTGSNPYNSALSNSQLQNPNAVYPAAPARPPYIDAGGQRRPSGSNSANDDRLAVEYGVVTIQNQENTAIVLNRVLLGLLAATTSPQSLRQLAALIYPTQQLNLNTPKFDEEIDPLFAVTLADIWAVSSIPKPGKPFDLRSLGDNGHWNDLMCPTTFALERAHSIRYTTAELLGGLDGLNLGMFRRRLSSMRRNLRLSELLRFYYSRSGFKPQYPDVGICNRATALNSHQDELRRQAEIYLRLYQLSLPTSDSEIAAQINRLDSFREHARQVANFQPEMCQQEQGGQFDLYPSNGQDQCEISRADLVAVMDASEQANKPFMQIVIGKLAQRVGLSRYSSSMSIMTNQQDSTGYAGAYSFNTVVKNSTNLGEIGCALVHDSSSSYQGGLVNEPTRLMEMFERALVNLDSEYLTRQLSGYSSSSSSSFYNNGRQTSSYMSAWFGSGNNQPQMESNSQNYDSSPSYYSSAYGSGDSRTTGGAKVILWFNYGRQVRPSTIGSGATMWTQNNKQQTYGELYEYKFYEAKKYLRENFRGASILALAPNRDDVKAFVFDEERDIMTDVASGPNALGGLKVDSFDGSSSGFGSQSNGDGLHVSPATYAMLGGQADQLVSKLMQRMCTISAVFQYPMCFRVPSDNAVSSGYITPGRKQYWMMSPKTFFASQSVRLTFKVDGGRLRVCFGRKQNPDETAQRYNQQYGGNVVQQQSITFQQQQQQMSSGGVFQQTTPPPVPTSSDYYTGMEYGVCKDVAPSQEIDFLISDPCYKKSIAECEPFYFVIRELSQVGEGDPNYLCRDDGCKRVDQVKFVMSHTGVSCNSTLKGLQANWFLIMISTLIASIFSLQPNQRNQNKIKSNAIRNSASICKQSIQTISKNFYIYASLTILTLYLTLMQQAVNAQLQAGVYDFGQGRSGEKRGNFTPSEVLAIILIIMLILGGLALTIGLCYYVTKRAYRGMQPVNQDGY